jgi:hypothetical protein
MTLENITGLAKDILHYSKTYLIGTEEEIRKIEKDMPDSLRYIYNDFGMLEGLTGLGIFTLTTPLIMSHGNDSEIYSMILGIGISLLMDGGCRMTAPSYKERSGLIGSFREIYQKGKRHLAVYYGSRIRTKKRI